jgi:phosphate-selective porin OprO/OprP
MIHRQSIEGSRPERRAARASFLSRVARRALWSGLPLVLAISPVPGRAQSADPPNAPPAAQTAAPTSDEKLDQLQKKVDELDQAVKVAQRKQELAEEAAAEKAKADATVTAGTSGFTIRSPRGNYVLRIGADLQVDNRTYLGIGAGSDIDTLVLRRVRPTFSGTIYQYIDFMFRPDFGQGTTAIYDAYVQLNYLSWANLRAGKFKPPVGLERLQNDDDTNFIERGLPTNLGPQRDIGYQLSANLFRQRAYYAVGVFNGVPDASIGTDTAVSDHRDYSARLFLTPFQPDENALSGLGFGMGVSGGNMDGEALPSYKTFGQQSFFTFASGVTPAGHRTRLDPQAYYYLGAFGLLTEYALNEEGFQKSNVRREIAFRAYQVQASYILTGEKKSYASPTPKKSFDPLHGGWGAWEIAARLGDWEAEKGIYSYGLASSGVTPRHLHEWVGGVNWYLNRLFRISADYGNTNFGGGAPNSNKLPERTVLLRFQINFI